MPGLPRGRERQAAKRTGNTQSRGGRSIASRSATWLYGRSSITRLERLPLVLGQPVERGGQPRAGRQLLLDRCVAVVGRQIEGQSQSARRALSPLGQRESTHEGRYARSRAAKESRAVAIVPKAPPVDPCLANVSAVKVARRPFEPSATPGVDPEGVSLVELSESPRVRPQPPNQPASERSLESAFMPVNRRT